MFAIDDFGTGYGALASLEYFPIDTIELECAFVSGIGKHPLDETIAATISTLAVPCGFAVTAESVETEAQRLYLEALGVSLLRGNLFARPCSATAFAELVTDEAAFA